MLVRFLKLSLSSFLSFLQLSLRGLSYLILLCKVVVQARIEVSGDFLECIILFADGYQCVGCGLEHYITLLIALVRAFHVDAYVNDLSVNLLDD